MERQLKDGEIGKTLAGSIRNLSQHLSQSYEEEPLIAILKASAGVLAQSAQQLTQTARSEIEEVGRVSNDMVILKLVTSHLQLVFFDGLLESLLKRLYVVYTKEEQVLRTHLEKVVDLPQSWFGVPKNQVDVDGYMDAILTLRGMASERLPTGKLIVILKAVSAIEQSLEHRSNEQQHSLSSPTAVGADDMMPIFHYVVAHAALAIPDLFATVQFLRFSLAAFYPKGGMEDYWLTMFEGAVVYFHTLQLMPSDIELLMHCRRKQAMHEQALEWENDCEERRASEQAERREAERQERNRQNLDMLTGGEGTESDSELFPP